MGASASAYRRFCFGFILACSVSLAIAVIAPRAADAADTQAAIDKANIYIELAKSTERAVDSWERYASWVNMKTGPTGKERYFTYGMYELYDVDALLKEARKATASEPRA